MTAQMWGAICDRCARPFRTADPAENLCRFCYLGALSPTDRAVALLTPWRP